MRPPIKNKAGRFMRISMEFVELLLLCVAVLLLIFKPEQEKLAWWLTVGMSATCRRPFSVRSISKEAFR